MKTEYTDSSWKQDILSYKLLFHVWLTEVHPKMHVLATSPYSSAMKRHIFGVTASRALFF